MIGSYQSQTEHVGRSNQETIGWILMRERQFLRRHDNVVCKRSFVHVRGRFRHPVSGGAV